MLLTKIKYFLNLAKLNQIICNTTVDISKYQTSEQISCKFNLRILESLHIHKEKPKFSYMYSVTPLLVLLDHFYFCIMYA